MPHTPQNRDTDLALSVSKTGYQCPMFLFVNLVSGKWAIPILYRLIIYNTPVRFNTLKDALKPISQKELTKQLRLFEKRGLVTRTAYMEMPLRVEYQITPLGASLRSTLDSLADWMGAHGEELQEVKILQDEG